MKLDDQQAIRIRAELVAHIGYNNQDAVTCFNRFCQQAPDLSQAQAFNAMLEAGDPYLTEIVSGFVLKDLS